jgi:hypothetical protein
MLYVQNQLQTFVGHLKEFEVINLEDIPHGGYIPGIAFCRKRVRVFKEEHWFIVKGEHSIPIPESLTTNGTIRGRKEQLLAWRNYHLDLSRYTEEVPEYKLEADTMRALFLHKYPSCVPPTFTVRTKFLKPEVRVELESGFFVTEQAKHLLSCLPSVTFGTSIRLTTISERIRYALGLGSLLAQVVIIGQTEKTLLTTKHQRVTYVSELTVNVGLEYNSRLLNKLIKELRL